MPIKIYRLSHRAFSLCFLSHAHLIVYACFLFFARSLSIKNDTGSLQRFPLADFFQWPIAYIWMSGIRTLFFEAFQMENKNIYARTASGRTALIIWNRLRYAPSMIVWPLTRDLVGVHFSFEIDLQGVSRQADLFLGHTIFTGYTFRKICCLQLKLCYLESAKDGY